MVHTQHDQGSQDLDPGLQKNKWIHFAFLLEKCVGIIPVMFLKFNFGQGPVIACIIMSRCGAVKGTRSNNSGHFITSQSSTTENQPPRSPA